MSLKLKSLGSATAAARGIVMSAITSGTPIAITLTAGHRQRNNSRVAITGLAADNAVNGEWSLSTVAATSANLDGSTGGATLSGTPIMAALCDRTPFIPGHSAVALISAWGAATTSGVAGTVVIEGADRADFAAAGLFYYNNRTTGVEASGLTDMLLSGEIAMPAGGALGVGGISVEVRLARYMTMRVSSWTSGTFVGALLA